MEVKWREARWSDPRPGLVSLPRVLRRAGRQNSKASFNNVLISSMLGRGPLEVAIPKRLEADRLHARAGTVERGE